MTELNPVFEALIHYRVADIVDPPRSWRKDMKAAFLRLPPDLQHYFADHDRKRDLEIRRAHNERADAVKKLAATEDRLERAEARLKEIESAESKTAA
jgi:hypothetical protein